MFHYVIKFLLTYQLSVSDTRFYINIFQYVQDKYYSVYVIVVEAQLSVFFP